MYSTYSPYRGQTLYNCQKFWKSHAMGLVGIVEKRRVAPRIAPGADMKARAALLEFGISLLEAAHLFGAVAIGGGEAPCDKPRFADLGLGGYHPVHIVASGPRADPVPHARRQDHHSFPSIGRPPHLGQHVGAKHAVDLLRKPASQLVKPAQAHPPECPGKERLLRFAVAYPPEFPRRDLRQRLQHRRQKAARAPRIADELPEGVAACESAVEVEHRQPPLR